MSQQQLIELTPLFESTEDYDAIERKIEALFKQEIYIPLLREFALKGSVLKNAKDDLLRAIQSGRLTFQAGKFSGKLSSTLSKELRALGAKWDRKMKVYSIPASELPYEVMAAISSSEWKFVEKMKKIDEKIAKIVPDVIASKLKMENIFDRALYRVNQNFNQSVKGIKIAPQLSEASAKKITEEWQKNIHLSIKGIVDEVLPKLRKDLQENAYKGNRYESMVKTLQSSYGLSASRAKYVARNDTNLLLSKFKQERLAEVGVHEYKWKAVSGTPHHPVRPIHRELTHEGKVHRFDSPPIAEITGERYNPGERNNCRCYPIPVIRFNK